MDEHEEHTGFYVETMARATTQQDHAALMRRFAKKHNDRPISTWIDETQARAEAIRDADGVPEPIRRDAVRALGHCLCVRHYAAAGDVVEALYEAYQLGMVVERLGVRQWEKYVAAAVKQQRPLRDRHKQVQRDTEIRDRQIVAIVDELDRQTPDLKVDARNKKAGVRLGIGPRSVARALARRKKNLLTR